ncbi:serine hydrolase domain-containing protein [Kushneria aurantia]|uniref:Serine hydrolase domain-containing protein n=1 Tax=Kushneria aurantia TaxID=504092 RepID=A0ABV6FYR7_9GAMM|nr:serine hydrolase [Kushneria aurantia]
MLSRLLLPLSPALLSLGLLATPASAAGERDRLDDIVQRAGELPRTHTLVVAIDGDTVIDESFRGHRTDATANIKSLSKTLISALVGAAIDRDIIRSADQPVVELLAPSRLPADPDPRLDDITVGQLLSMQSGLERTSGQNYGSWVASGNWTRNALARPFVAEPGGPMLYSTGNSHILSAALTDAAGRSTLALARDWLGEPLGITIPPWTQSPEGVYFGGNEMGITPLGLLRFGEMYRLQGEFNGQRVLSAEWVEQSWQPRTRSVYSGDQYGYGWFMDELAGSRVYYGRGYGGQVLFVVPDRAMTVVMTSDPTPPSNGSYNDRLKGVVEALIRATEPQHTSADDSA